jgi:hypothetical protein
MYASNVMCFEKHISEAAFLGKLIWNFIGNQPGEVHISSDA